MVRAIDMQQVITQAYPVEKVQQAQQQHPDIQQRYFDVKLNEEQRLLREKVKNTEESMGKKIGQKEEGKNRDREMGKRNKESEEKEQDQEDVASSLSEEGTIIDVKV